MVFPFGCATTLQPCEFESALTKGIKKGCLEIFFCIKEDGMWREGRNEKEKEGDSRREVKVPRE